MGKQSSINTYVKKQHCIENITTLRTLEKLLSVNTAVYICKCLPAVFIYVLHGITTFFHGALQAFRNNMFLRGQCC